MSGPGKKQDLDALTPEQRRELLGRLMRERQAGPRFHPLSFPQQRLWFLDQLEGSTPAYHVSQLYHLEGDLSVAALERAMARLVARHESLRTVFVASEGKARQAVLPTLTVPLPVVDLRGLAPEEGTETARRLQRRLVQLSFDLSRGPLVRLLLVWLGPERSQLAVDMHHIISDVWSVGVLTHELGILYAADRSGRPASLPALPIQYGDFARWQRKYLEGERLDKLLAYWHQRLEGAPPVLELPADRPRPASPSGRGGVARFRLSPPTQAAVRGVARSVGGTPFMVLLGAFTVLLYRYSGQHDLCVGMPIANRTRSEVEGLIGFFVNTLVLRLDAGGAPSFRQLLGRVSETTLGAYDHQDLPFERLVEELQPQRDLSHHPLFQVLFQLQTAAAEELRLEGLRLRHEMVDAGQAMFDLLFYLEELAEGGVSATVQYARDLFDEATVERMCRHYRTLLAAALENPETAVTRLPLLAAAERRQVLVTWNERPAPPTEARLDELFFAQAWRTPDEIALVAGGTRLSYRELARRVTVLARSLRHAGVGPEITVGVCLPRTPDLVVALLGVLTAGGAYVPLDPAYPRDRVAVMLEDSGALLVLGDDDTLPGLPETAARRVPFAEMAEDSGTGEGAAPLEELTSGGSRSGDLAYLIFTSGSTGRPKAVAIEHRSAVGMVRWALEAFSPAERRVMLAATSVCFDLSVFELFVPLAGGSRLVLVDSALGLAELPVDEAVSLVNTVPSAMAELARLGAVPPSVRVVNLAGEPLPRELVDAVRRVRPEARVFNLYGPSEDTTYSTVEEVPADGTPPTIGRPLPGTRAHLLDPRGEPVPVGVVGELLLGGAGLARGYLGRPALTAERFVPDPFAGETRGGEGARLYRTGDLARFLPDGRMLFLGRSDHQVKVRGFRIELGEVESALLAHPRVREALVSVWGEGAGERRLVAHVALEGESEAETEGGSDGERDQVRQLLLHLRRSLPDYMLPSATVIVDALPRTPNGKVDRRRLPAPEVGAPAVEGRGARSPLEDILCGIWAEVLGRSEVGVEENFFELGGHSLLATQVVSRMRAALGVDPPLKVLFQAPTVAELALQLEAGRGGPPETIPRAERDRPLPLSFSQERLWFFDRLVQDSAVYNIPGVLRLEGSLHRESLARAVRALTVRHETLRTRFAEVQGDPVQAVVPASEMLPPWCFVDLSGLRSTCAQQVVAELARLEARRPFDLRRQVAWRSLLVAVAEGDHRLLVTFHHILADGWSQGIFFRDLGELYSAAVEQRTPVLPALPVHFPDYALWQRRWLRGERLEGEIEHWRQRLEGAPRVLELPTDRPRPAVQSFHGGLWSMAVPEALGRRLEGLGRSRAASLFMVLLAGFETVLHRHTGATDLSVGVPVANRHRLEVEGLIGFFVNTLVLRCRLDPDAGFSDLLAVVREATLDAHGHQDLPFEKLVEALRPERDLAHSPLFQVMLSLLDQAGQDLHWPGLEVSVEALDSGTSKFDLTLHAERSRQGLRWVCEYNADLFDPATIERFAGHLASVLDAAAEDPEVPLWSLPLLTAAERSQLDEWNATTRAYGAATCLHRMFEEQAELLPDAVALEFESESLEYRTLNRVANVLAHRLRTAGVGVDTLVGVFMERSVEMVVALLAILKAGGGYVPLDPDYPQERLAFMAADAGMPLVLIQEHLRDRLPESAPRALEVSASELAEAAAAGAAAGNLEGGALPDSLAYMIYTSGSTGRPKGAMNSHRAIYNRLLWMQEAYRLDHDDRVLQKTPFSFDVSVWEFFWPLITAARLVVARPGGHQDPAYLAETLQRRRITTLHFVPSMLQVFLEQADIAACRGLRRVICSGEALPAELVRRFHSRSPAQLHNLYGPTEAAIDVTFWHCDRDTPRQPVPIGRPIANTQVHVVDRHLQPVPVGVPGELLLGGVNLARGYRGRPALTAERFIPDPFGSTSGGRLYRTGDETRWAPEGAVEFLGRFDFQVKLRGLRIELGEIESALADLEAVRETVVLVREDDPGDHRLVAYWVPAAGAEASDETVQELRRELRQRLPDYMVPGPFVALDALPLSPNGKVDRKALPAPGGVRPTAAPAYAQPGSGLARDLAALWQEVLKVDRVGLDDNFFDLGGHSLLLLQVQRRLEALVPKPPSLVELFQYPTLRSLTAFLRGGDEMAPVEEREIAMAPVTGEREIAVVAAHGRFPGAAGVEELWANLRAGVESISFFTDGELESSPFQAADPAGEDFVKAGGVVEGVELFDAGFFGLTPLEAEILDPQQRLFLECAWEALEQAGVDPQRYPGRVGVWAGEGLNSYLQVHLLSRPEILAAAGGYQLMLSNSQDFLATRVAYKLGLRGPAVTVQSACSTSLVAVHMACRALRGGECEVALAGGVTVRLPQRTGYQYEPSMIQSPDGHCRAFDADARGTVSGNGLGVVVLKRLSRARADGDRILAVIKGSAVNNDGALKVGFTAPAVEGQSEVIAEALADAGVEASAVGYVEAHGTGTELGDPIEVAALTRAYRRTAEGRGFCALGSIKTNLGHLDAAAGVAGLIKAALTLERELVPPSLHYQRSNPQIDFEASPFFVNTEALPWPRGGRPRLAGVSSFGIGGTNAHVILEEAPPTEPTGASRSVQLLMLSARTPQALEDASERLAAHLAAHPEVPLADVAFTLQTGRRRFDHRRVVVCPSKEDPVGLLAGREPRRMLGRESDGAARSVAFLFPGQGAQYPGMGLELYQDEAVFRHWVDHCCRVLEGHLAVDLREVLFPPAEVDPELAAERLRQTRYAQPALFVVEYSLARLWQEWGIEPRGMLGHSLGEWTAAAVAGVFELEDALQLVALRGRLMQSMEPGSMLSVQLGEEALEPFLGDGIELAAVNAPELCSVSGPEPAVSGLCTTLQSLGIEHRRLHTSHAFHSAMMEAAVTPLVTAVAAVERRAPKIPFVSNVSGAWIRDEEAQDPEYWGRQLRAAVRFADGAAVLLADDAGPLLEVGPGRALASLVRRCAETGGADVVTSLPAPGDRGAADEALMIAAGKLWLAGVDLDWRAFYDGQRRAKVQLPTYPFERRRYWVEPGSGLLTAASEGKRSDVGEWFYVPSWRRSAGPSTPAAETVGPWLVATDGVGVGAALVECLRAAGETVTVVVAGEGCRVVEAETYTVAATDPASWRELLRLLAQDGRSPLRVVHGWAVDPLPGVPVSSAEVFRAAQSQGQLSLLALARALADEVRSEDLEVVALSSGLHRLDARDPLEPAKAPLLGLCRVLPQEYPHLGCRAVDLDRPSAWTSVAAATLLAQELRRPAGEPVVAFRGGRRWVQVVEPVALPPVTGIPRRLREGGVYLITGGLGGVGLVLARYLAESVKARLVLVGRSKFPPPEAWLGWLLEHGGAGPVCRKILELQNIQEAGSELLLLRADVADHEQMNAAVQTAVERFGRIDGVIHCAGVAGQQAFQPIQVLTPARCDEQLQPKAYGTMVLRQVLEQHLGDTGPDFVLVMSSIAGVLGGRFFAAYAGANLAADALVQRYREGSDGRWLSVAWDGWRLEETMPESEVAHLAMTAGEGVEALRRILDVEAGAWSEQPVVVSTADLETRRHRWLDREQLRAASPAPRDASEGHARPTLSTAFQAPSTASEKLLAGIWCRLLGLGEVGVHDDFFELGGHSLLATQLLGRLRKESDRELTLQSILENPTVAEQALLLGGSEPSASSLVLPRVARDEPLPLTFSQERLWFLWRLDPASTAYSLPAAIHLRGRLRLDVLRRCFQAIVHRHAVLRAVVQEQAGGPRLVIAEPSRQRLPLVDLQALPSRLREAEVYRLAYRDAERPFDLGQGPLIRHTLVRLDRDDHVFIANTHHLVSDGWSGAIFIRELAVLYEAFLDDQPSPLPELEVQYGDYAHWQRQWLQGEVLDEEIEFWRGRLEGAPPTSLPPMDRPRPVDGAAPAGRAAFALSPDTTEALRRYCHGRGVTLFMVTLAAFHLLLERYTGQEDLALGTPVANRHRPGTEALIGMFINTVVIRAELTGDPLFDELVEEVKLTTVAAQAHQEVPFEKLVEVLKPERPEGVHPLFQVMVAFNHEPPPEPRLPGLDLSLLDLDSRRGEAVFDLSVGITDAGETVEGSVQYNRALYDASTIERLLRHYVGLLDGAVQNPRRRCSELEMMSPAERHQALIEWRRPLSPEDLQGLLAGLDRRVQSQLPATEDGLSLCLLDRRRQPIPAGAWGEAWLLAPPAQAELWAASLGSTPAAASTRGLRDGGHRLWVRTEVAARWLAGGRLEWRHRQPPAASMATDPLDRRARRAEEREVERLWRSVADRTAGLSDDKRRALERLLGGSVEAPQRSSAVVLIQPEGERQPFFCVHAVAGDVTGYVELARHLGGGHPFAGLQAPGIDGGETPLRSVEALAQRYVEEMRAVQPAGPYLLGGWSMGALVALEVAHLLGREGESVELLALIEPAVAGEAVPGDESELLRRLIDDFRRLVPEGEDAAPEGDGATAESLDGLAAEELLEHLVAHLRRSSPAYASLDTASSKGLFEVYKANVEALAAYRPVPWGGAATLFMAESRQLEPGATDPVSYWHRLLPPGTPVEHLPGNHRSLLEQPCVRQLASLLRQRLREVTDGALRG